MKKNPYSPYFYRGAGRLLAYMAEVHKFNVNCSCLRHSFSPAKVTFSTSDGNGSVAL